MATTEEMQADLAKLRDARMQLLAGTKAVTVSYSSGNGGGRRIEYSAATLGDINAAILELETKLGCTRRRAIAIGTGPR